MKKTSKFMAHSAIIAALYVVLTYLANALGLASGAIQIRFSESLTILPVFTSAAIPGLFIGCFISNLLSGCVIWDVIFGSIATLIGALCTYLLRKYKKLACIPPILSNTIIIPFVLKYAYGLPAGLGYFILTIGVGEIVSCGILGTALLLYLQKYENAIKWKIKPPSGRFFC